MTIEESGRRLIEQSMLGALLRGELPGDASTRNYAYGHDIQSLRNWAVNVAKDICYVADAGLTHWDFPSMEKSPAEVYDFLRRSVSRLPDICLRNVLTQFTPTIAYVKSSPPAKLPVKIKETLTRIEKAKFDYKVEYYDRSTATGIVKYMVLVAGDGQRYFLERVTHNSPVVEFFAGTNDRYIFNLLILFTFMIGITITLALNDREIWAFGSGVLTFIFLVAATTNPRRRQHLYLDFSKTLQ